MPYQIIEKATGKILSAYELAIQITKSGSPICYCDIECVAQSLDTNEFFILDECGNWEYIDPTKYEIRRSN